MLDWLAGCSVSKAAHPWHRSGIRSQSIKHSRHTRPGLEREQYPVTKRFMFVGLSIWGTRPPPRGESCLPPFLVLHWRWWWICLTSALKPIVCLSVCCMFAEEKSVTRQQSPVSRFNETKHTILSESSEQELARQGHLSRTRVSSTATACPCPWQTCASQFCRFVFSCPWQCQLDSRLLFAQQCRRTLPGLLAKQCYLQQKHSTKVIIHKSKLVGGKGI